ncbi:hypothetical protein [Bacillus suaedae]|uniref:Uncharacterized protein n=1 Tax=Halalkalibacter suaedae TaxID=2822140 RepID=A0A940X1I1_9BACI|nr:hypothetical protein [Bacillus suaedae]MBP3953124.1 hypothetical protein [Bacillus suaedae]
MEEKKFYNSRIFMLLALIVFGYLFFWIAKFTTYSILTFEMNWKYWAGMVVKLLFSFICLRVIVYTFKQIINPTLVITLTEAGVIVEKDKRDVEIGWEDIESYMICGKPSHSGGTLLNLYLFLNDGIASNTVPKELKIEYHFMKNKKILIKAFEENKIKELPPNYEFVKNIK